MRIESHAKINWVLRVGPMRPDGYHDIETVFHEVAACDLIDFQPLPAGECRLEGFPPDLAPEQNLMTKAWRALRDACPGSVGGIAAHVQKRIPAGGGLGGGSSNAAAMLKALNDLYALDLPASELQRLALTIGSDVPFFLSGGCALGRGRGDVLTKLRAPEPFHLVMVFPGEPVSTAAAYTKLDSIPRTPSPVRVDTLQEAIGAGCAAVLVPMIENDFEAVVRETPWFQRITAALLEAGCLKAFLSGSGSTMLGLTSGLGAGENVVRQLQVSLPYKTMLTRTLTTP
jgi:4-diphosphocytidyl-2-C-methyl-D-erythritol kinase